MISRRHNNRGKTNYFILTRQFFFMKLSTKLGKIKLMRLITKANTNSLFFTIYFSINGVQERSTKYNGTKVILWGTKNKEISRVFYFPTQDFNISNNPKWCDGVSISKFNSNIYVFYFNGCYVIHNFLVYDKRNSTHTST